MNSIRFLAVALLVKALFGAHVYAEELLEDEVFAEAFLEFLIEFEGADDETFEMMVENGIRDQEQAEINTIVNQGEVEKLVEELNGEK